MTGLEDISAKQVCKYSLQIEAQLCCNMLDRPPGPMCQCAKGRAAGGSGIKKVKTKAILFVGTKETKGCARNE